MSLDAVVLPPCAVITRSITQNTFEKIIKERLGVTLDEIDADFYTLLYCAVCVSCSLVLRHRGDDGM